MLGQPLERMQHVVTGDRAGGVNDQPLAGIFIHHRQHLHGPAVGGPIHNEIPRPDVAWIRRLHRIAPRRPEAPFPFTHWPHAQAFLPTHPLDAFAIDRPAFATQQLMNKSIAPTRVLLRQRNNSLFQALPPIRRPL